MKNLKKPGENLEKGHESPSEDLRSPLAALRATSEALGPRHGTGAGGRRALPRGTRHGDHGRDLVVLRRWRLPTGLTRGAVVGGPVG